MNIRPIQETDIEAVIHLFRLNYGDDYALPEFYDPQWVKRGVYSDHILWLVIEDEGRIVASGACILNFGDYNDQIGEIGRLVVDPSVGGKGLGRAMLTALVDASDDRVEFAFAEARTTHPKTQKILDHLEMPPLGFLPMHYQMDWRESFVLNGQLFGNGRALRRPHPEVIPAVAPLAALSLKGLELDPQVTAREARPYPLDQAITVAPLTGASLVRLLRIEQGRMVDPEIFSGFHIDLGVAQLRARKAQYLVASDGDKVLGAVGYQYEARDKLFQFIELIAQDEAVKGALMRRAMEQAAQQHEIEAFDVTVSAYHPRLQQTLFEMGFLPMAYVPGMVFHGTGRWDVVKMAKLNIPWNLGPMALTEPSQAYFDLVAPAFERAAAERERQHQAVTAPVLAGLTALEFDFFRRACVENALPAGAPLAGDSLHVVLEGAILSGEQTSGPGSAVNTSALMSQPARAAVCAAAVPARVLTLSPAAFAQLGEQHPRLAVKLYRNLARG
jgi:N-acetylglutamate synthase-like GNAT family acetyltransferase